MRAAFFGAVLGVAALCGASPAARAATLDTAPSSFMFQGRLMDTQGSHLDGTYRMRFGIRVNGTRTWYAEYTAVVVQDGFFSVTLGASAAGGTPLDPTTGAGLAASALPLTPAVLAASSSATAVELDLEVDYGGSLELLTPGFPIGSSLFALKAETIDGFDSTQLAKQDASGNVVSSNNTPVISPTGAWIGPGAVGGSGGAAGSTGQVQFNAGGTTLGADAGLYFDAAKKQLFVGGPSGSLNVNATGAANNAGLLNLANIGLTSGNSINMTIGRSLTSGAAGVIGYTENATTSQVALNFSTFGYAPSLSVVNGNHYPFPGSVGVGAQTTILAGLDVQTPMIPTAGVAYGIRAQQSLTAQTNNDALHALYIDPTFNDGGKTGVTHSSLVVTNGRVGFGLTAPAFPLDVVGDINSSTALRVAGTQVCTSAGCTAASDARLKERVRPLEGSLDKLLALRGVSYLWIDKAKYGAGPQVGFIAQELEKIYPEVVVTDGRTGNKSVAYDHLVAPVVEALKTLHEEIEGLKRENREFRDFICAKESRAAARLCGPRAQPKRSRKE